MNEAETRAELIDPALRDAGWGVVEGSRVRREQITLGRLVGGGRRAKQDIADYVLEFQGRKLAVIEAKKRSLADTEGVAQAKRYADKLGVRFAYSTNGVGIYRIDMHTGVEGHVGAYPDPQALWDETFAGGHAMGGDWRDRFSAVPFEDRGGFWQPRYYQDRAINAVLDAIGAGEDRILLTLATGTGKTSIAFQIAWKLFHARWSLAAWKAGAPPSRRPRILFLADRNILADQAFNAFAAFEEDALVRVDPASIRKHGRVPKNANVFFTIFQTFMTGTDADGDPAPFFGDYPPDFFDFIVIDECHRGGANDESTWRAILEHFSPAVQLGLTATPRRDINADTYRYFGEPVFVYSLREGIDDGYLTPFKVRQIATTLDDYVYTGEDEVLEGEVERGQRFGEDDFNRVIEIRERERYRVSLFMEAIDQNQKTLVFCATQDHALAVRDLINQAKRSTEPNYCVRVTANDGAEGERFLRLFQDNEKTIPTILTTSQKLSTGVDARNVRNIVLMRPVNSMIEFKQIIGRGTRLYDGKDYFTIFDFVKAYAHFNDPEWDGEPVDPGVCPRCHRAPCVCENPPPPGPPPEPCPVCGCSPCCCERPVCPVCGESPCVCEKRVKIRLADGKERRLQNIQVTTFWGPDGKPVTAAQFIETLYGALPELFRDEDELRAIWGMPDTRARLLEGLEERGFGIDQLREIGRLVDAEQSDLYDVLAYIAYTRPPITRLERVESHKRTLFVGCEFRQKEFLDFVLEHYIRDGVGELAVERLPDLIDLKYHGIGNAIAELGSARGIREVFVDFQQRLYAPLTSD
ncbi:MAG: DEAD/DEAH box helicase family protein [Zoogloeaceae bacterium]|nr:DEAD/DEAH box helicase family protein [Zoogloeaceae bacterium]